MGQYLDAVATIPAEAEAGETVTVRIDVTAKFGNGGSFPVTATAGSGAGDLIFQPAYAYINPSTPATFEASFSMPEEDTQILWGIWYMGGDGVWHLDVEELVTVMLTGGNGNGEPPDGGGEQEIPWLPIIGIGAVALLGIVLVRGK